MEYRKLPHGEEKISIIGLGSSALEEEAEAERTMEAALASGINYFDLAAGFAAPFAAYGRVVAAARCRGSVYYQIHFGADYRSGKYGWTLDLDEIKRSVSWQLDALKTDYIDFGFMHCIDEEDDLKKAEAYGTLKYLQKLKAEGTIRHIGLSTHTPSIAQKVIDTGLIDMLMFSINPAYDYQQGEFAFGALDERAALYRHCEMQGVGISVMKPFSGGQLLDEKTSPFHKALTEYQCIQYALDKPGVITVLPGVRGRDDLKRILGFFSAAAAEKDYSVIGGFAPAQASGVCVYCNHCAPCPAGLDVGLINKYYDLARAGDVLAKDHYLHLQKKASDCVACGHCDSRCPFHAQPSHRMEEIDAFFSET